MMAGPCRYPPICHLPWPKPRDVLPRTCIVVCVLLCLVDGSTCTSRFRTRSQRSRRCAARILLGCGMTRRSMILGCLVFLAGLLVSPPPCERMGRARTCTHSPFGSGFRRRTCNGSAVVVGFALVGRPPKCVLRNSWLFPPQVVHLSSGQWACH